MVLPWGGSRNRLVVGGFYDGTNVPLDPGTSTSGAWFITLDCNPATTCTPVPGTELVVSARGEMATVPTPLMLATIDEDVYAVVRVSSAVDFRGGLVVSQGRRAGSMEMQDVLVLRMPR